MLSDQLVSMRDSDERTKCQALAVYLFWLKTLDQMTIAALFGLPNQQAVSRYLKQTREGLMKKFVPDNIGINSLIPENIGINNLIIFKYFTC